MSRPATVSRCAARADSASSTAASTRVAWSARTRPASVRRSPRPSFSTSVVFVSRSSLDSCWETADGRAVQRVAGGRDRAVAGDRVQRAQPTQVNHVATLHCPDSIVRWCYRVAPAQHGPCDRRHVGLAVAVAAVWGVNFVVIHVGLAHLPPLLFSALRFGLAAVPAIFFVPPAGRARGAGSSRSGWSSAWSSSRCCSRASPPGMPAGLSSLVLQSQAVFTVVFAVLLLRERPRPAPGRSASAVATAGLGRGRRPPRPGPAAGRVRAGDRRGGRPGACPTWRCGGPRRPTC